MSRLFEPGEGRELVVADVRAYAVFGFVACTGVIDRDPRGRSEAGAQHITSLTEKSILTLDQQPHELALGDVDAEALQQGEQTRDRGMTLKVLRQHEPLQLGPEVGGDPGRQRRHDGRSIRQLPALAPVDLIARRWTKGIPMAPRSLPVQQRRDSGP